MKDSKTPDLKTDAASPAQSAADDHSENLPAEPPPLTREEVDDLRERAEKSDENWNKFLRAAADLENYKKRASREKQDTIKFANESLLQKLIPLLDNFEMALAAANNAQADSVDSLKTGIAMIHQQFKSALAESGVEEIDALGKPFDPNFHEAVSQQTSADVPEGHVLQQLRKGYRLRERLIRPATVIVSKGAS